MPRQFHAGSNLAKTVMPSAGGRGRPRSDRVTEMAMFVISFGAHAMDRIPRGDMPDVAKAAHAVCCEAIKAGVFVCAGGLEDKRAGIVATDGTVTDGQHPEAIGGFTVVDVQSRADALEWAARIAAACRCPQEVWEVAPDAELTAMLREADRPRR